MHWTTLKCWNEMQCEKAFIGTVHSKMKWLHHLLKRTNVIWVLRVSKWWQKFRFWVNYLFKSCLCEYIDFILWISIRLHIYVSYFVNILILAYYEPILKCHQPMSLKHSRCSMFPCSFRMLTDRSSGAVV